MHYSGWQITGKEKKLKLEYIPHLAACDYEQFACSTSLGQWGGYH